MGDRDGLDRFLARLQAGAAWADSDEPEPAGWLAQVVAVLFDGQEAAAARDWAARVHGELRRLDGRVPFGVVHDWHAHTVIPLLAETLDPSGADLSAPLGLHARALAGERVAEAEWVAALEPAMREVYRRAYAHAEARATARATAHAYATANGYSPDGAVEFAESYAELSTGANAASYADANAIANARATAAAYATADAEAYALAYPYAQVQAWVFAHAGQDGPPDLPLRRRATSARLADGLADCLARATG